MFKTFTGAIKRRPYHLLLLAALLAFVLSLFMYNRQVDIHLYDTYIVTSATFLLWPPMLFFTIIGLLYLSLHRFLPRKTLTWLHVILTLATLPIAIIIVYWYQEFASSAITFVQPATTTAILLQPQQQLFIAAGIALVIVGTQLIFIGHLIYGITNYFLKKQAL
ncbi:MAG: hypothetical protein J7623_28195 [Chitinophaga sp.]|uniref:hypothetical protein n=1 Tax=Chitinophaga sp. TaxID=1869181 RepID=UPI001B09A07D|nr:hypothetical protein [Chitinophaga sp.]MBO9732557.1 hypothetical protein [Chitinophaga sp.]